MREKRIIFTVTSDPDFDQRMLRICHTLHETGYLIQLIGRKTSTQPNKTFPFKVKKVKMLFKRGKLFYAEYNLKLFFKLLFKKCDAICSIDLDTILPGFYVSKWRRKKFIYDSHEYFTEQIEIVKRPKIQKFWERIEQKTIPNTQFAYTVCQSIAEIYTQKYGTQFKVIRNVPFTYSRNSPPPSEITNLIYIGAVNEGRGLELAIESLPFIPQHVKLLICGYGDVIENLKSLATKNNVENRVTFTGRMSPEELRAKTEEGHIGIVLLKNEGLSYYYSLANKFFDYVHAEIPQITIDFPEYNRLNNEFRVSKLIDYSREAFVNAVKELLESKEEYIHLQQNCQLAKKDWCWEKESQLLVEFYQNVFE